MEPARIDLSNDRAVDVMPPQLETQAVSIVLRGPFSPAIFHPSWFALHELVRRQESEAAKVDIIHPNAAVFTTEWLQINVVNDRFLATTSQESYYEPLRDLVVGVLELLSHTPLRAMGVNRDFHYRLDSEEAWHGVGHGLAPKQHWEHVLKQPGMLSLTVESRRPDEFDGYIRVKVEPSTSVKYGVYIQVNDHYQLKSGDEGGKPGTREATRILAEQWNASMQRSLTISQQVVALGETG